MNEENQTPVYPEDIRLRRLMEDPDRRMTREEWEREFQHDRQAAHERHAREDKDLKNDDKKSGDKKHGVQKRDSDEKGKAQHSRHDEHKQTRTKKPRNWKMIALIVGAGLVVLLLIFFIGWLPRHKEQKKAQEAAKKREQDAPEVEVVQVKRGNKTGALTVPGTTAPLTEAYIYARANGYLKKRLADIGDHVKKGQLLALIDAPDLDSQVEQARQQLNQAQAQLEQQKAQLNLSKVTWDRWRTLVAKGVFSRQDGDQRETDYLTQEALVASAQRNVDSFKANLDRVLALQSYERVTAPFDGVITERNIDIGALVGTSGAASAPPMQSPSSTPTGGSGNAASANTSGSSGSASQSATPSTGQAQGGALFGIAQFDKLRILVSVPEGYANSIHRGMAAQVFLQENIGKPILGKVTRVADSIDPNSRTMLAEVDLDNKDGKMYPGIYSVVTFMQVRGIPPLTVPGDAVVVRNDRTSVATVQNDKVQIVPVEIGRDYGPSVEILSGLREGDWIVSTVTDAVRPGVQVRTRQNKEAAQEPGGGSQTNQVPDAGPNQYGDQSVVNSATESTTQKGKPGQKSGGDQKQSGGKQQQGQQDKKGSSQ